jgi:hypothetical protein
MSIPSSLPTIQGLPDPIERAVEKAKSRLEVIWATEKRCPLKRELADHVGRSVQALSGPRWHALRQRWNEIRREAGIKSPVGVRRTGQEDDAIAALDRICDIERRMPLRKEIAAEARCSLGNLTSSRKGRTP